MTDTVHRRLPRSGFRLASPHGARLVAVGGPLLTGGIAVAATFAGVSQQVRLPDWWGPWPLRRAGSFDGYVVLEVILLGCLCALWTWQTAGLLRRPATVVDAPEGSAGGRRPVAAVPALLGVGTACAIPLLVSGPIGSLDVQSYAAIGRLAAIGLDPYRATPGLLGDGYSAAVDPLWRWTPTPYGPLQVQLLRATVLLAGDRVGLAVLLIRGVAVVALAAAVVISLRAAQQRDRLAVLVLIVLNPVVLLHVVSGAHFDVLIGALAVLVIGLSRRGQHATAMALAVVACAVKLPGAVLVAYVVVDVLRRTPRLRRTTVLSRTLGSGLGSLVAVAALCHDPFGWVSALGVPGIVHNGAAPSTWMAYLTGLSTGHLVGPGLDTAFTIGRTATSVVGTCAAAVQLWRATSGSTRQAYHGVGWALLALAVTGPALYPWYLTWGLFAAALGSGPRGRIALVGLSSTASVAAALGQGWAVFGVWSAVLLAVLGYTAWAARAVLARDRADAPPVTAGLPYLIEQA
jgi:hypothetical protein